MTMVKYKKNSRNTGDAFIAVFPIDENTGN